MNNKFKLLCFITGRLDPRINTKRSTSGQEENYLPSCIFDSEICLTEFVAVAALPYSQICTPATFSISLTWGKKIISETNA